MTQQVNGFTLELRREPKAKQERGGWTRITHVLHGGTEIGRIRSGRHNGRRRILTQVGAVCVTGRDLNWLVQEAGILDFPLET